MFLFLEKLSYSLSLSLSPPTAPGVIRQVRPIVGPFHTVLQLEMNYVVGGVMSQRNIINVHIFVSEFWF